MDELETVRLNLLRTYHYKCVGCGQAEGEGGLDIHEIVPRSLRPRTWMDPDNRIPVCRRCHDRLQPMPLQERIALAERWKARALGLDL